MAVNRLFYLMGLAAALAFYLINGMWFSWIVLLVLLLLPLLSLLCSLPAMLTLRVFSTVPPYVEQGQQAAFHIRLTCKGWLPEFRVRLELRQNGEKILRYLSKINRTYGTVMTPALHAGQLCYTLSKGRVYDLLGLFYRRIKLPEVLTTAVLPHKLTPEPVPDLSFFRTASLRSKVGGGVSEVYDHREYREGDNVRSIQWKLSCKSDKLIVREPLEPVQRRVALLLQTPADAEELDSVLGQLRTLADWLGNQGYAFKVHYIIHGEPVSYAVKTAEDCLPMLIQACALPCGTTPQPVLRMPQTDWLYVIRPLRREVQA